MTITMPPDAHLLRGQHSDAAHGMCAMELVAHVAGEAFSDAPVCVSPVVAAFMRRWNDDLPDADRDRLLLPLLPGCVGTRDGHDEERAWLCVDWLCRTYAPAWLEAAGFREHADALRALPAISGDARARAAQAALAAAWAAAWAAARAAAWDARAATWDAAWAATRAAAWDAARDAAWDARAATWDAAWAAARDAAWAATWDAAWAAARDARAAAWAAARAAASARLAPTAAALQASAQDLVRRLCAMGREGEQ